MKRALTWSLSASLLSGFLQVAMVPFYVSRLGLEAWGVICFQIPLAAILQLFDFGIATTVNQMMASRRGQPEALSLLRVGEAFYAGAAFVFAIALGLSCSWLAESWLTIVELTAGDVATAIGFMIGTICGNWMSAYYAAALGGQERFATVAGIRIAGVALFHGGNVIVLALAHGSLPEVAAWQCTVALALAVAYRWALYRATPATGRVDWSVLRRRMRFIAGVGVIAVTAVAITHVDKLVLSKVLTLEAFGLYTFAMTAVGGLLMLIAPIFSITVPRLAALAGGGPGEALTRCYLDRSQLMAWLVMPVAMTMLLNPYAVIMAWTGKPDLAASAAVLVSLALPGTMANALMNVPFALQLAIGRPGIGIALNLMMLATLAIGLLLVVPRWGAAGGAVSWSVCNLLYLCIGLPITNRLTAKPIGIDWTLAVVPVLLAAVPLPLITSLFLGSDASRPTLTVVLAATALASWLLAAGFARRVFPTSMMSEHLRRLRVRWTR
ncbi:MAG TPA: hypothetical protein VEL07_14175 [Planctomycetota bacterium]|nr:hypothetical protein [Planctomycetota bacterium]